MLPVVLSLLARHGVELEAEHGASVSSAHRAHKLMQEYGPPRTRPQPYADNMPQFLDEEQSTGDAYPAAVRTISHHHDYQSSRTARDTAKQYLPSRTPSVRKAKAQLPSNLLPEDPTTPTADTNARNQSEEDRSLAKQQQQNGTSLSSAASVSSQAQFSMDFVWGFHASSIEATGLYQGCAATASEWGAELSGDQRYRYPELLLIGFQKSGTTSLEDALEEDNELFCSASHEAHMFDDCAFATKPIELTEFRNYFTIWDGECDGRKHLPRFEKSPGYATQTWAAKRICETMPNQRLAAILREPADRAYSSFYEGIPGLQNSHPAPYDHGPIKASAHSFHHLAKTEMDIVKTCGIPITGEPTEEMAATNTYAACCNTVASSHGWPKMWSGCQCNLEHSMSASANVEVVGTGPHHYWHCGFFGDKRLSPVRNSIYVDYIRVYLRYHKPADLLFFNSSAMIDHMPEVAKEMAVFASQDDNPSDILKTPDVEQVNAHTSHYDPMLVKTRMLLEAFYRPYNRELFALLGRKLPWAGAEMNLPSQVQRHFHIGDEVGDGR